MEIEAVSEGLDHRDHPWHEVSIGTSLHVLTCGSHCTKAQITEEASAVSEEGSHHLGDGKDHLPVRHTEKKVPAQPDAPGFQALGMT